MQPIIATGTQRSGTTLLYQILQCSSRIWARNELHPIHELIFSDAVRNRDWRLRKELGELLELDLSNSPIGREKADRIGFLSSLLQDLACQAGKQQWCLKDPQATYFLNDYAEAFPSAKFVITIRDPRAVVRSYLDPRGFRVGRPANFLVGADRWRDEVQRQLDFVDQHSDRTLVIKFESLVTDLTGELSRLAEFLEIPLEASMLEYFRNSANTRIHDGNENILRPPDPSKANVWRDELTAKQVSLIESRTKLQMAKLQYHPEFPPIRVSPTRELFARVHHRMVYEYRWQRFKLTGKS